MQKVLTAEEMREVDRLTTEKYGIPSIILMENAAHAAARVITEKLGGSVKGKSVLILCGKGSNGGDGAALARILWTQGADVLVALFGRVSQTKGDAKKNFQILKKLCAGNIHEEIRIGGDIYKVINGEVEIDGLKCKVSTAEENIYFYEISSEKHWDYLDEQISRNFAVVVDSLLGTGVDRELEGTYLRAVYFGRSRGKYHVSIDIPSGLNADLSEPIGKTYRADLTISFTAPKPANVLPPASNYNGELVVANIGSSQTLIKNSPSKLFLLEKKDTDKWFKRTKFTSDSYKNKRGHALLIVGSKEYTGAAVLAGNSAMVSGVGLTTIATSESAQAAVAAKVYEEVIVKGLPETKNGAIAEKAFENVQKLTEKVDVVGIGCGIGDLGFGNSDLGFEENNIVREIVEKRKTPVVIDADGLNALAPFDLEGSSELPLILTPHEGEFLRLLGTKNKDAIKDRVKAVRDFAEKYNVILVLKGERVLIGAPDGRVVINPTGNSGLGKAGNGDTLTGIITGFVAQAVQLKIDIFETVVAAIYISSLAGDIAEEKFGKRSMLASDVRECLGAAFASLRANGE